MQPFDMIGFLEKKKISVQRKVHIFVTMNQRKVLFLTKKLQRERDLRDTTNKPFFALLIYERATFSLHKITVSFIGCRVLVVVLTNLSLALE